MTTLCLSNQVHFYTLDNPSILPSNCPFGHPIENRMENYNCYNNTQHTPPLIYDMDADPAENFPLNAINFPHLLRNVESIVKEHKKGLTKPEPLLLPSLLHPSLVPCCNPPKCSCPSYKEFPREEL